MPGENARAVSPFPCSGCQTQATALALWAFGTYRPDVPVAPAVRSGRSERNVGLQLILRTEGLLMNLRDLELKILELHNAFNLRTTAERAIEIGLLLLEAKRELGHGNYLPWLGKLGIRRSTAHSYTQVASANVQPTGHLTLDGLLRIIRVGRRAERGRERRRLAMQAVKSMVEPAILCMDAMDWLTFQPDNSVPFFVTDAPYGFGTEHDGWTEPTNADTHWHWLEPYWRQMRRVVQPGGVIVLWQAYCYLADILKWFEGAKIIANCYIVRSIRQLEPIIKWTKPGAPPLVPDVGYNDWTTGNQWKKEANLYEKAHPCPKPLHDCREIVRRYTLEGALVVDCFCGVGSISLACLMEGRKYLGIDRSKKYVKLARQRLAEAEMKRRVG